MRLRRLILALFPCSIVVSLSCGEGTAPDTRIDHIMVTPATTTATSLGQAVPFSAKAYNAANAELSGKAFTWTSSNTGVATISGSGAATPITNGTTEISASAEGVTGTATLTVAQQATSVTVTPSRDTIVSVNGTRQLAAQAKDAAGATVAGASFSWSSSSASTATVNGSGLVTAVANGSATITATTGGLSGTATIVVRQKPATIAVSPPSATLTAIGQTQQLAATASDAGGTAIAGTTFTWTSSSTAVATVSAGGLVTAVASGSATITAGTDGITGTSSITVNPQPPQSGWWAGYSSQNYLTYFRVAGSSVEGLGVTISAALSNTNCITTFTGKLASIPIAGSRIADTLSHTSFTLQGKVPFNGTFTSASAMTLEVAEYNGIYTVQCGSTYQANDRLWSALSGQVRPVVATDADLKFQSVSANAAHTCALTEGGAAYCWGIGSLGRLGSGTTTSYSAPQAVSGGLTFASLTTGWRFTCGLTTNGVAYCWGDNLNGQLGDGTTTQQNAPVPVQGGLTFKMLSAGQFHTCGVTMSDAVYCWGNNAFSTLGNGTTTNSSTPVPVSGGGTYSSVDAGDLSTCAITTGGVVRCWGTGPLGTGSLVSSVPAPITDAATYSSVSVGTNNACGITTGGLLKCWGTNGYGEVGDGSKTQRPTPVQVGTTFASVAMGVNHVCAVSNANVAHCWGSGTAGKLGNATLLGEVLSPTPIAGGVAFKQMSAAGVHSCGVNTSNVAYCWGWNDNRQLGHGKLTGIAEVPMPIGPKYP